MSLSIFIINENNNLKLIQSRLVILAFKFPDKFVKLSFKHTKTKIKLIQF